jgi:hypothetical protein
LQIAFSLFCDILRKNIGKKHLKTVIIGINIVIVATGFLIYKNIFSLLPMFGVLLHTGAFWLDSIKQIRLISFLGSRSGWCIT